jgi:OOP family OmpA-OmpF porin
MKVQTLVVILAFVVGAAFSIGVAWVGAIRIEARSIEAVAFAMRESGHDWVSVTADGLEVQLTGMAPDEASRFNALTSAGSIVAADRIVDHLDVVDPAQIEPPRFSLEMLRNDDGVSLIGLIPSAIGSASVADALASVTSGVEVANMVETADYPIPTGWSDAFEFGLMALRELPRSKISIYADRVEVTAVSSSPEEQARLEALLARARPRELEVQIDISAPRPVITPYTLRFVRTLDSGRFEACSADTEATRDLILRAGTDAGLADRADCPIGLGVPSPTWGQAVSQGIAALNELGVGTITFSDADVTLVAAASTPQNVFDRVLGDLDAELPEVFSLHGVLLEAVENQTNAGPANFVATRSPEGYVQLRGRLTDDRVEQAVLSYARALFGRENTYLATRTDPDLPEGWPVRVLAGLESLGLLNNGTLVVEPDNVIISGNTGSRSTVSAIARILSEKIGEAENFEINVVYQELLDPEAGIPTPEECVDRLNDILMINEIIFAPGSLEFDEASNLVLDEIAAQLPDCRRTQMEIGGHTDSQGRETMNLSLSQARADAVLNGLLSRNVLTSNLSARGYGETRPIADNDTDAGREENRRIEFRLLSDVIAEMSEARGQADETEAGDNATVEETVSE